MRRTGVGVRGAGVEAIRGMCLGGGKAKDEAGAAKEGGTRGGGGGGTSRAGPQDIAEGTPR